MALRLYRPGQPCARESMCEVRGVVWENAKITKADCALVQMRRASAQGQMCKTSAELDEDVPGLVATTAFLAVADCRLSRYHIFYFSANSAELDEDVPGAELDEDVPGLGRHYCIPCGRYFQDAASLVDHEKGKPHKKRCACVSSALAFPERDNHGLMSHAEIFAKKLARCGVLCGSG
eukprot:scaffold26890_cov19-Tisochrysis_lutea.AAC.4